MMIKLKMLLLLEIIRLMLMRIMVEMWPCYLSCIYMSFFIQSWLLLLVFVYLR